MLDNSTPFYMPVAPSNGNSGNGFWNGDGIWAVIIFALIFGWGGNGFGGFGGGSAQNYTLASDFATIQRQLSDGFGGVEKGLDTIRNGLCDGFYTEAQLVNGVNMNLAQGFNTTQAAIKDCCCQTQQNIKDTQYAIATTGAGIQGAIKDCCCENEKIALQNRYESAQQNCATLQAIQDSTRQIIDYMAAEKAQNLRDENFALKLASSQEHQNNVLINTLRPVPVPSFPVPSPFYYGNGGYGFYNGTTIA